MNKRINRYQKAYYQATVKLTGVTSPSTETIGFVLLAIILILPLIIIAIKGNEFGLLYIPLGIIIMFTIWYWLEDNNLKKTWDRRLKTITRILEKNNIPKKVWIYYFAKFSIYPQYWQGELGFKIKQYDLGEYYSNIKIFRAKNKRKRFITSYDCKF